MITYRTVIWLFLVLVWSLILWFRRDLSALRGPRLRRVAFWNLSIIFLALFLTDPHLHLPEAWSQFLRLFILGGMAWFVVLLHDGMVHPNPRVRLWLLHAILWGGVLGLFAVLSVPSGTVPTPARWLGVLIIGWSLACSIFLFRSLLERCRAVLNPHARYRAVTVLVFSGISSAFVLAYLLRWILVALDYAPPALLVAMSHIFMVILVLLAALILIEPSWYRRLGLYTVVFAAAARHHRNLQGLVMLLLDRSTHYASPLRQSLGNLSALLVRATGGSRVEQRVIRRLAWTIPLHEPPGACVDVIDPESGHQDDEELHEELDLAEAIQSLSILYEGLVAYQMAATSDSNEVPAHVLILRTAFDYVTGTPLSDIRTRTAPEIAVALDHLVEAGVIPDNDVNGRPQNWRSS